MKLRCILIVLAVWASDAVAQNGNYSLSHFIPVQERSDYLSFDLAQDERGIIYIAGKGGIEEFDGRIWRLIPTPGVARTLTKTANSIMVGGLDGYGQLINDPQKGWAYQTLSLDTIAKNIFASLVYKDTVYFINEDHLFSVSATTNTTIETIKAPEGTELTGIFDIMGKVQITTAEGTILNLENTHLPDGEGKFVPSEFSIPDKELLFVEKFSNTNDYLIGTGSNHLFVYSNDKGLVEIKVTDQAYLDIHIISDGVWLNDQIIAIGTLRGGVVFINRITGLTEEIIDYNTGLPDNEVFALLCDKRQGIWVAHSYGYTRIATNVPFRSFSHYKGLTGNLLTIQYINGRLYAGTSVGLFLLTKEEVYDDEVFYVTKKNSDPKKVEETQASIESIAPEERQRAKRGLFKFLKKEKKKAENQDNSTIASGQPPVVSSTQQIGSSTLTSYREKRIRKVLRSLAYSYKKVNGIEGKVTQLWKWNEKLLAAGPSGLYEVTGEQASVISEEPIRSFMVTKDGMTLVAATYDDEVKTFSVGSKGWNQIALLDTLRTFVSFLFEDNQENIWLCGLNAIYKAEMADGELVDVVKIPFSNPMMAETFGTAAGSDVFVVIAGKFLRFDFAKGRFVVPRDSLSVTGKSLVSGNRFWYFDGHSWSSLDPKLKQKFNLAWLNLFSDLRFIAPGDKMENLWVITSSNELYRLSTDTLSADNFQYPLFLKDVRNPQSRLTFTSNRVKFGQELGEVTLEFIQPEFSGLQSTEYRYWVKGLQKDWSSWSALNNEISFPFLPIGTYKVLVQARDLFGKVTEIEPVSFIVTPPYWKQAWFYAAEVAFFSMLVVLSIRLSAMNESYRVVSRVLSLLTVILLIQLIQTAAYSMINVRSTPVVDFFIQVCIALLVLPLEFILRKFMTAAAEGKFSLNKLAGRRS
ncbi:MAG: triple tyrosine motif-containing protein [Bacteroidota bacterium]